MSRNVDLLHNRIKVDRNFPIVELLKPEAWTLFKKKVGNSIESWLEINSLAKKVCKKCKGLPVAINALGAALEGKPEYAWKNALDEMERYMLTNIEGINPSVWASLRVSYDMLQSSDAQSCFLLCCLFAKDTEIPIDDLTRHCVARSLLCQSPRTFDEATNAVNTVVGTLKSSSLLLNDSNENIVRIHDVVRDVGISIAREEKAFMVDHGALQWPRNPINGPSYSAISLRSGKIKGLPDGLICPQLHTLILDNDEILDLEVPNMFFSGMEKLTVLILTRLRMRQLPSSLANLTNLRMLYLEECELEDIAILGDLKKNLEMLSLRGSDIKALPQEMGQLTGLRLLDLRDCGYLKVIPQGVISNLTSLEELYFPFGFDKWEATSNGSNVSLEELRLLLSTGQLTTLHIHIPDVMLLPNEGLMFKSLKRFKITVGQQYEDFKKCSATIRLVEITFRNELIPLADKAEVLYLDEIEDLEKVLHNRRVGNEFFEVHPLLSFKRLTELTISYCKIKYIFSESTARGLIHLKRLVIIHCKIMEEIVRFEGQNDEDEELISEVKFSKLQYLDLDNLPKLISFYAKKEKMETNMESSSTRTQPLFNEKVVFPVLEALGINGVGNITDIWDKQSIAVLQEQGSCCQLKFVGLSNCKRLRHVFPSTTHPLLKNLKQLYIHECRSMEGIIVGVEGEQDEDGLTNGISFSKLTTMELSDLPKLISFCTKPGKEGTIESSSSTLHTQFLFDEKLQNLQDITIRRCKEVEVIVSRELKEKEAANNDVLVFPHFEHVELDGLDKLKSFCSRTHFFFSDKDAFPILMTINLDENLEIFRNGTSTKKVVIEECGTSGKENDHNGEEV